jgi:hypothetical protein
MNYSMNDDEMCNFGKTYFTDYEDLISVSGYIDNPDVDKITNIINAMIQANIILQCKQVSFKINFNYGKYNNWVDIATFFNKNLKKCNKYHILIDEESLVCICL